MHYALETEHQTDRKHADAENTQVVESPHIKHYAFILKVHTLEKKHKWASKHMPLLLEACTIMGKQHYFFEVRTVMTKHTTLHYSCAVNNSSNFFSNVKPICIPLPMV